MSMDKINKSEKVNICAVILAAGLGTRMKSSTPKVLHKILGKPIIEYVVNAVTKTNKIIYTTIVIANHSEEIKDIYSNDKISFAYQKKQLGTADALKSGVYAINLNYDHLLVINGDTPLIRKQTLSKLIKKHLINQNDITILSFKLSDPTSYGRIVRDKKGSVKGIVEEKDATKIEKSIKEVNSGMYIFSKRSIKCLDQIKMNRKKGEYYLTDVISIGYNKILTIDTLCAKDEDELLGINSQYELLIAQKIMQHQIARHWLDNGVTLMDIDSIMIEPDVKISRDTTIYPNVIIEGNTKVGEGCTIHSNTRIVDSIIKDKVIIKESSLIEGSRIHTHSVVGPFAHIKPKKKINNKPFK